MSTAMKTKARTSPEESVEEPSESTRYEQEIRRIHIINSHRTIKGLPPLEYPAPPDGCPLTAEEIIAEADGNPSSPVSAQDIPPKSKVSRYQGITWMPRHKKWRVQLIRSGHPLLFLGDYTSELDAARAYDRGLCQHDCFTKRPNFPDEMTREWLEKASLVRPEFQAYLAGSTALAPSPAAKKTAKAKADRPAVTPANFATSIPTRLVQPGGFDLLETASRATPTPGFAELITSELNAALQVLDLIKDLPLQSAISCLALVQARLHRCLTDPASLPEARDEQREF